MKVAVLMATPCTSHWKVEVGSTTDREEVKGAARAGTLGLMMITMVCTKIPRRDTNEVGEYEVTVTSELHEQSQRTQTEKRGQGCIQWRRRQRLRTEDGA